MDNYSKNRLKLFNKIDESSVVVLFAGKAPQKRGDEDYPFSPDRNFYYITGLDKQNQFIMLSKINQEIKSTLYIERDNGNLAKWVGANITIDEINRISDFDEIKYIDEFEEDFSSFIFKNDVKNIYLDLERRNINTPFNEGISFANKVRDNYPHITIKNIYPIFAQLRKIKEDYELVLMQKAMDITTKGIEAMMKIASPGMYEYEIEAYFDFVLKRHGVKHKAFETIAASGKNGTVLHYTENNSKTKDGDLILFDVGAQFGWYNGDITRTFPVNGKFTSIQKKIYNIVLSGQQNVIDSIKPGVPFRNLNEILKAHYLEELSKLGIAKSMEDVQKYYYHNVSHMLGAETHDIGRNNEGLLEEGMVITVEPGLYIDEMEIGIRIEDDVLVTKDGCVVMTQDMIKTVEDIEDFMAKE